MPFYASVNAIKSTFFIYAFLLFAGLNTATPSQAQQAVTEDTIAPLIRQYLLENPEILIEMQQALEQKQQAELAQTQVQTIRDNQDLLYRADYQIEFGNPNATKTIVEFFDYNCGFCQRALMDMQQLLEADDDLRFVLKEFPVLGQPSFEASRVSMAFSKIMPEKYSEFHVALLRLSGLKDGERALELAESMGADRESIVAEMENPQIIETIREIYRVAESLGMSGTPSYIIGEEVVFGAVGYETLSEATQRQ